MAGFFKIAEGKDMVTLEVTALYDDGYADIRVLDHEGNVTCADRIDANLIDNLLKGSAPEYGTVQGAEEGPTPDADMQATQVDDVFRQPVKPNDMSNVEDSPQEDQQRNRQFDRGMGV